MARSAPPDKPAESAIIASMRTKGDGPENPADRIPVDTTVIDAEILGESDTSAQSVAVRPASSTAVDAFDASKHPAMIKLNSWLEANRARVDNPELAVADIIAQVINAQSVDEVLSDVALPGLREHLMRPFILHDAKVNQSSFEAGAPYYFVCDVEWLDTGVRGLVTTGAQSVIAQIMRLIELDGLPCTMMAKYSSDKPTSSGYRPYKLSGIK